MTTPIEVDTLLDVLDGIPIGISASTARMRRSTRTARGRRTLFWPERRARLRHGDLSSTSKTADAVQLAASRIRCG